MSERSVKEVLLRCDSAFCDNTALELVNEGLSPNSVKIFLQEEEKGIENSRVKAGRWLAILRRDFKETYEEELRKRGIAQSS